jgi:outer membrane protein assembly factor BamD (BamD/ComL family)
MKNILIASVLLITLTWYTAGDQTSVDQTAWKEFRSLLTMAREKNYDQAVAGLDRLVKANKDTELAAQATMEIGRIYLNGKKDPGKALIYFDELVKNPRYRSYSDLWAEANFRIGEIKLARASGRDDTTDAQAEFDRVYQVHPDSEWAAQALLQSAIISDRSQNREAAIDRYQRLALEYTGATAAQARLSLALHYAFKGNPLAALLELQTIRNQLPESDRAKTALQYATELYRFYKESLGAAAKPYPSAQEVRLREIKEFIDPNAIAMNDEEQIFIADRGQKRIFKMDRQGRLLETLTVAEPGAVTAAADGAVYIADQNSVRRTKDNSSWRLSATTPKGDMKPLRKITSMAVDSAGNLYAADAELPGVVKYSTSTAKTELFPQGQHLRNIKQVRVDALDNVYLLDDKENKILIYNRAGELAHQLALSGKSARSAVADFSAGPLNYIYVLSRNNAFYVYEVTQKSPPGMTTRLVTTVPVTARLKEPPEAMGVSRSGTVFLAGKKSNTVLIYR